ncbi:MULTISPECIES: helix-turn-helix transcriptional regulator [Bacillus]|uniref:helix-turn-helix transcriptional regulator n=1 Tax=Bacillus TaxID=1386 RepID=UPI000992B100|nr:helix-turn-helix transcriptional regulator [Bacillus pseudomycoides]OOR54372.1 transcriptional regulator [Bacillus pseudomycoides]PEO45599.1 XRE family transcriptional regulator [Bacillus pseudomycoides]
MNNSTTKTNLKKAFEESGYTYEELAKLLGISYSYCYKVINNEKYKKNIYYNLAAKIALVLEKDVTDLFREQVEFF